MVTADVSSKHHFFMVVSVANMPNLPVFVWLLAGRSELVLPASRAGETQASFQLEAMQQCLASTAQELARTSRSKPASGKLQMHTNDVPTHVPLKIHINTALLSSFHPQIVRRLETKYMGSFPTGGDPST